jgi:hypothetical protein
MAQALKSLLSRDSSRLFIAGGERMPAHQGLFRN